MLHGLDRINDQTVAQFPALKQIVAWGDHPPHCPSYKTAKGAQCRQEKIALLQAIEKADHEFDKDSNYNESKLHWAACQVVFAADAENKLSSKAE
jgi:hypothetical protein